MGLVGNCQFSALVHRSGAVLWCCLPRFDSDPIFASLLDERGGEFLVGPADGLPGEQRYLENTNVLETVFHSPTGTFRILDFAPRFLQHERAFRPTQLYRIIEPVEGTPRCAQCVSRASVGLRRRRASSKAQITSTLSDSRARYD